MLDLGPRIRALTVVLSRQLAKSCPGLSLETRVAFAAQIAAAALRAPYERRTDRALTELGGRDN
jgi:hypothetical protein